MYCVLRSTLLGWSIYHHIGKCWIIATVVVDVECKRKVSKADLCINMSKDMGEYRGIRFFVDSYNHMPV